jgi:hypothetical protein
MAYPSLKSDGPVEAICDGCGEVFGSAVYPSLKSDGPVEAL